MGPDATAEDEKTQARTAACEHEEKSKYRDALNNPFLLLRTPDIGDMQGASPLFKPFLTQRADVALVAVFRRRILLAAETEGEGFFLGHRGSRHIEVHGNA